MSQLVLVGYASAHGSTREIAERVAARLTERGCRVEIRAVDEIRDVGGYDAVVLGSAVHNGAWLDDAVQTVRRNTELLATRPVWLFSVGMSDALRGPMRTLAKKASPKVIESFQAGVHPRDHRVFSGVIRSEHLPWSGRVIFRSIGARFGDYRDWEEIDAWAEGIAAGLADGPQDRASVQGHDAPL